MYSTALESQKKECRLEGASATLHLFIVVQPAEGADTSVPLVLGVPRVELASARAVASSLPSFREVVCSPVLSKPETEILSRI